MIFFSISVGVAAVAAFLASIFCIILWDNGRGSDWAFILGILLIIFATGLFGAVITLNS